MASLNSCQECSPAEALHTSQDERSFGAHRASRVQRFSVRTLASWNVRPLLDVEGPIETARQGDDMQVVDERKIDQVVDELDRYKIDIAALQETKWFGEGVYRMGESTVLAAGRPVPRAGVVRQRGEGVVWSSSWCLEGRWQLLESLELEVGDSYFGGGEWQV